MKIVAVAWLGASALLGGCQSTLEAEDAGPALDQAEAELARGAFAAALERLETVSRVPGLEPDLRAREQRLIDAAARGRFAELAEAPSDELVDLFESELPERVRAQAGVLAAERLLAEGSRILAYRQVKAVDEALPGHHEGVDAGDVLARAGLSLIHDEGHYALLFSYRARGMQALEYLVVHHGLEPRCAEALFALSEAYEAQGDLDEAIERTTDLLVYHPDSPFVPAASARLPYLRLCRLGRDDYDRGELLRANGELAAWLQRHPEEELTSWVQEVRHDCLARLVRSDLYLAHFYERTGATAGQRLHAERARAVALEVGLEAEAATAERLLAGSPEEPVQERGATSPSPP
jgi:tetratricopeptide (TPR) repeat protein